MTSKKTGTNNLKFLVIILLIVALPVVIYIVTSSGSFDTRSKAATDEKTQTYTMIGDADSAYEVEGRVYVNATEPIPLGWGEKAVGIRFNSIALRPLRNATIVRAKLSIKSAANAASGEIHQNMKFEDSANCQPFTNAYQNITGRKRTVAKETWVITSETPWSNTIVYKSPNLKDPLQELVNKPYFEGNSLCLLMIENGSWGSQIRPFWSKNLEGFQPTLEVTYIKAPKASPSGEPSPTP